MRFCGKELGLLSTLGLFVASGAVAGCGEEQFTGNATASSSGSAGAGGGSGGVGGTEPIGGKGGDGGQGACNGGEKLCGGTCIDTSTDPEHCGGCDAPCDAPMTCSGGRCSPLLCGRDTADCDMDAVDCETTTSSDPANCGTCGNKCTLECVTGVCDDPIDVSAGGWFTCALLRLGDVYCWGDNTFGQLGDGTIDAMSPKHVPQKVPLPSPAKRIFVSPQSIRAHACAIVSNDDLYCWGANSNGQIGAASADPEVPDPTLIFPAIVDISLGTTHTCALEVASTNLFCWGANGSRQLGVDGSDFNAPTFVTTSVKHVAAGGSTTCIVGQDGTPKCWGDNSSGQAGDPTFSASVFPTTPPFPGAPPEQFSIGAFHTCALLTDGGVQCFGESDDGRLGFAQAMDTNEPTAVVIPATIERIELGSKHSGAASSGALHVWGANSKMQLGDGGNSPAFVPIDIGLTDVIALSFGMEHACAIQKSGLLSCWGSDDHGQLGNGPGGQMSTPTPVMWP